MDECRIKRYTECGDDDGHKHSKTFELQAFFDVIR